VETGFSVAEIVLGYLIGQPFAVFPIVGPKKVADLEESISAGDATLTAEQLEFLTVDH
jgi:aryl-alcohol dehydrogenase-like predicted oxidoreductase